MQTFKSFITEARKYKLFIDDERKPAKIKFDYIARDYKETMKIFDKYSCPSYISFDHDLGANSKTGFDIEGGARVDFCSKTPILKYWGMGVAIISENKFNIIVLCFSECR